MKMRCGPFEIPEPEENGVYVAEVYFGWKILAWRDGEWWHETYVGRWTASKPLQWVGPLPARIGENSKPAAPQYDL